jgi:hypothetical protein
MESPKQKKKKGKYEILFYPHVMLEAEIEI